MEEAAEITLARCFDNRAWKAAERAVALPRSLYRLVQESHPALVRQWDPAAKSAEIPPEAELACKGSPLSQGESLIAFTHAVAAGAHATAARFVDRLLDEPGAIGALHRHWLALGDHQRAEAWAKEHAASFTFPGALDPLELSDAIDESRLDAPALARLFVGNRREILANSELHLLAHRCLLLHAPTHARAALNRYLRCTDVAELTSTHPGENYLRGMRFARPAPVYGGPRVSIILSAFNAENTIEYSIRSILNQSYQNIELLVCDDNSDDSTLLVAKERFAMDPRVRFFRSRANQGSYNVRNALIAEAAGDLITTHDADDISLPRRIERQVAQLRSANKRASVTNFLRIAPSGKVLFFGDRRACRMAIVSLMASREVFAEVGPYRGTRFAADFEFLEKLKDRFGASSVARIRSPQLFCLWASSSVTRSAASEALASGYRSPARRAYSDLVYRERVLKTPLAVPEEMSAILVPASGIDAA